MSLDAYLGVEHRAFEQQDNASSSSSTSKRESAIKLATDKKRKIEQAFNKIKQVQQKNGLVFNKDGTFGVVQANYSEAKKREVPASFASSAEKHKHSAVLPLSTYEPLRFLCCNADSCDGVGHNHRRDLTTRKEFRSREYYYDRFGKELFADMQAPPGAAIDADLLKEARAIPDLRINLQRYASQPLHVKDLFNVVLAYTREHDRIFPLSCDQLAAIDFTEEEVRQRLAHHPQALEERLRVLETSRENVRATYTEMKDVLHRKFTLAIEFTVARLVQHRALVPSATATFSMYLEKYFRDYLATHDQEKLMDSIVTACVAQQNQIAARSESDILSNSNAATQ